MNVKPTSTTKKLTVNLSLKNSVVVVSGRKEIAMGSISLTVDLDSAPKGVTAKDITKLLKGVISGYRYDDNGNFMIIAPGQKKSK